MSKDEKEIKETISLGSKEDEEEVSKRLLAATAKAVDDICSMRETEGAKLAADLSSRANIVSDIRALIEERAPQIEKEYAA